MMHNTGCDPSVPRVTTNTAGTDMDDDKPQRPLRDLAALTALAAEVLTDAKDIITRLKQQGHIQVDTEVSGRILSLPFDFKMSNKVHLPK
jgi:hypothetical protein